MTNSITYDTITNVTKAEKREQRIRENPENTALDDLESMINRYGKIVPGGNHPKAVIGRHVFPYKRENPVKAHYVEKILELIDELKGEDSVSESSKNED